MPAGVVSPSSAAHVSTWRAMGTHVAVLVEGDPSLLERARDRIAELEQRWSRFISTSEISRLNQTRGVPVFVSADTRRLVRHGIEAWHATEGACDPSVLDAIVAAGYDISFERLADGGRPPAPPRPAPGCAGIEVDDDLGSVTLPANVGFDPGAIGKGLTADLVVEFLRDEGAATAFVSVGGDMRMTGTPLGSDGWVVDISDPLAPDTTMAQASLADGAVATSTTERRQWTVADERRHHVIDPATGRCGDLDAISVTVIAGDAWWAEAQATQLLLARRGEWSTLVGAGAALIVDRQGDVHPFGRIGRYLR